MKKGINLNVKYAIEVKDKTGKVSTRQRGTCRSLLRNFMYWLHQFFTISDTGSYGTSWTTADTSNTSRTFPRLSGGAQGLTGAFGAVANTSANGLRVGSSDAAVTPTDYELTSLIPHGTTGTELVYNSQTVEAVAVVGSSTTFRVSRSFTNNSGTTITVKEIGAVFIQDDQTPTDRFVCYLHDVLPSSVPVPDGSTFTLRYTFTVTI